MPCFSRIVSVMLCNLILMESLNKRFQEVLYVDEYMYIFSACNLASDCETCITLNTTFDCKWCDTIQRCSDGIDRHRKDWLNNNCIERVSTFF